MTAVAKAGQTGSGNKAEQRSFGPLFCPSVAAFAIVLGGAVFGLVVAAVLCPGPPVTPVVFCLIVLASLGTMLPIGGAAAVMTVRQTPGRLALVAVGCAATVSIAVWHLWRIDDNWGRVSSAVLIGLSFSLLAIAAKRLSQRNVFPATLRLATVAFVFKLAIVGLLTASFVPSERNPLGFLVPSVERAGGEVGEAM